MKSLIILASLVFTSPAHAWTFYNVDANTGAATCIPSNMSPDDAVTYLKSKGLDAWMVSGDTQTIVNYTGQDGSGQFDFFNSPDDCTLYLNMMK